MKKRTMVPFVKWVGGKRQLLSDLKKIIDKFNYKTFHEPFVGGGALFIEMLNQNSNVSSINDLNSELINTYKVIRDHPKELVEKLKQLEINHTRFSYYIIREMDRDNKYKNRPKIDRAARFIYLNKTSYNGIYRVNSKGQFNVPLGSLWDVKIFDADNIMNISERLKEISIHNSDYLDIENKVQEGDLVYFDPPYDSFENQDNFVGYQKEGFSRDDQTKLRDLCNRLIDKGVNVIVSNHKTKFIEELYSSKKYYWQIPVSANRVLNRNASNRGKKEIEVIVYGGKNVKKN